MQVCDAPAVDIPNLVAGVRGQEVAAAVVPDGSHAVEAGLDRGLAVAAAHRGAVARHDRRVVLAVGWPAMESVAKKLDLDGKIVIDVSIAWQQGDDGYPETTIHPSGAELIQEWNPQAKVVKTFATAGSNIIDDPAGAGGIVTMPVASNHRRVEHHLVARCCVAPAPCRGGVGRHPNRHRHA